MIKFFVVWTVINSFVVPCYTGPESGYDEYGQRWENNAMTLQSCYETEINEMRKEFNNHADVTHFMEKIKDECGDCSDFKLLRSDGVELNCPQKEGE